MPPFTMQEGGLTKGTSCPSHCPRSGASAPPGAWEGSVAATRSRCPGWEGVPMEIEYISLPKLK